MSTLTSEMPFLLRENNYKAEFFKIQFQDDKCSRLRLLMYHSGKIFMDRKGPMTYEETCGTSDAHSDHDDEARSPTSKDL
jgi:hypothetical protein